MVIGALLFWWWGIGILSLPLAAARNSSNKDHHHLPAKSSSQSSATEPTASVASADSGTAVVATIQHVLDQITKWKDAKHEEKQQGNRTMPFVTAAFAQSLNGILAPYEDDDYYDDNSDNNDVSVIKDGTTRKKTMANYPLSGPSSFLLTHGLRSIHDGILVGGRTLSMDNPRLTNSLWRSKNNTTISNTKTTTSAHHRHHQQPIPIVLDTHLTHLRRLGSDCRAAAAAVDSNCLIVCCSHKAAMSWNKESPTTISKLQVQILPCRCIQTRTKSGKTLELLDLQDVLAKLAERHGIQSIMVEGGATVLSSFLEQNLAHCLCITIAPTILKDGSCLRLVRSGHLHLSQTAEQQQQHQPGLEFLQLGADACFLCPVWNL